MILSRNNSSKSDNTHINSFGSKLRRLKIQENVLSANVNKCFSLNEEEMNGNIKYDKKYFSKLKDKFREVKNLFEDVTLKTNDLDNLEKSDIDDLKRDILELETKIRLTKQFIASELQNLRSEERNSLQQVTAEILLYEERKEKRRETPKIKAYKEIVPSPVRVMINSPLKCVEVQRFQDFIKNSINRYGGWNEYNHNIFVQIWNKYYGDNNMTIAVKLIEDTFSYQDFKEEVFNKIPGLSFEIIDTHSKWYFEYVELKLNQQKALNKWKENKTKIKRPRKAPSSDVDKATLDDLKISINTKLRGKARGEKFEHECTNNGRRKSSGSFTEKLAQFNVIHSNEHYTSETSGNSTSTSCYGKDQSITKRIEKNNFLKPTTQWLLKQESKTETYDYINGVENIAKLRIPTWRLNLNN